MIGVESVWLERILLDLPSDPDARRRAVEAAIEEHRQPRPARPPVLPTTPPAPRCPLCGGELVDPGRSIDRDPLTDEVTSRVVCGRCAGDES